VTSFGGRLDQIKKRREFCVSRRRNFCKIKFSDKQFVFLFLRFVHGFRIAPRAQNIQANLDALHQRRHCMHRAPKCPPYLRPRILDGFECSRQNAIHANQLPAQTVRSFPNDAIQSLGLSRAR